LDEATDDSFRCILICIERREEVRVLSSEWIEGFQLEAGRGRKELGGAETLQSVNGKVGGAVVGAAFLCDHCSATSTGIVQVHSFGPGQVALVSVGDAGGAPPVA
jgi:hypothetical protein